MCLAHIGTDMWSSVFSDMTGHCFSNVTPRLTFSLTAQVYLFFSVFCIGQETENTARSGLQHAVSHILHTALYGAVVNGGKDYKWLKLLLSQQKFQPSPSN